MRRLSTDSRPLSFMSSWSSLPAVKCWLCSLILCRIVEKGGGGQHYLTAWTSSTPGITHLLQHSTPHTCSPTHLTHTHTPIHAQVYTYTHTHAQTYTYTISVPALQPVRSPAVGHVAHTLRQLQHSQHLAQQAQRRVLQTSTSGRAAGCARGACAGRSSMESNEQAPNYVEPRCW